MKPIKIGLLGLGTVGGGTLKFCNGTRKKSGAAPGAASRSP